MFRVRFAPSPTGYLHIGGARTALFNWLFARRHGGVFVLRIEDTDAERSSAEMVEGILDGLRWLGLEWDEGPKVDGPYAPYFQSERLESYRAMAERLVEEGKAYRCYCTPEELQARRAEAEAAGGAWRYDRACCSLDDETRAAYEAEQRPHAIRFLVPPGSAEFEDLVRGHIVFDNANIEDFVVLRSDGYPTYHLSVVADDVEMKITHVVRGDDHISNTPKHVLLYRAVDAPVPQFAHVPLILGPDKKRLSKRHGATSVMEYARQGYLPEAMVNFLALLGWSPGAGDRELFTAAELTAIFDLRGISGGNAVFNQEKLDWFNQQHMLRLSPLELATRLKPWLEAAGLWSDDLLEERHAWFFAVLELLKVRAKRLDEYAPLGRFFFSDELDWDDVAVKKHLAPDSAGDNLTAVSAALAELDTFDPVSIETAVRATADARGVKAATLIHAMRVALTGKTVSPGLFEVASLLGRERVRQRVHAAIARGAAARA
ncbi:MAG: glutamate--tRNA ligase [Acidobacteria bacterium]|nr:glutamate--tRNA ligase [Acidobacteriota bacterium]